MKKTIIYILCCVLLISAFSVTAQASDGQGVRLVYAVGDTAFSGVTFYAYRIGSVNGNRIVPTDSFSEYPVSFDVSSAEKAHNLATTLYAYIVSDSLAADYTDVTDSDGIADFDGAVFSEGAYLFAAEKHLLGSKYYYCVPAIVEIPYDDADTVTIRPKSEEEPVEDTASYKVMKSWVNDSAVSRPDSVTVELLKDGSVYDTVVLNAENNWKHQWDNLPTSFHWSVKEAGVPSGYTVSVTIHGNTFLITNEGETVTEPTTGGSDSTTVPVVTSPTTNPHITSPSITSPTATPSGSYITTTAPATTAPAEDTPELPATGMLVWPIPYLVLFGMLIFMLGFVIYRKSEAKHD